VISGWSLAVIPFGIGCWRCGCGVAGCPGCRPARFALFILDDPVHPLAHGIADPADDPADDLFAPGFDGLGEGRDLGDPPVLVAEGQEDTDSAVDLVGCGAVPNRLDGMIMCGEEES
jgi:hypothetical protein